MLSCPTSVAAARASGASTPSRPSQAARSSSSSRTQRARGRRLLQCRAEQGSNGNGNGDGSSHEKGNGNGHGEKKDVFNDMVKAADKAGLSMGPISLSFGAPLGASPIQMSLEGGGVKERDFGDDEDPDKPVYRLNSMTTEEWQKKFVKEGALRLARRAAAHAACTWQLLPFVTSAGDLAASEAFTADSHVPAPERS